MSHRSAEEQSLGAPPPLRFKGAVAAIGAAVGCRTGGCAATVAAQVGTGNIVGASGAILIGGPGAIFWVWVIAFFAMATIYAEAVLAQKTKVTLPDGSVGGGPVYYIRKAFPGKFGVFLAGFFAVAIILALGGVYAVPRKLIPPGI